MNSEIIVQALDPSYLNLIIMPTEQCNFRCTYCYEDFAVGKMPASIISGVKLLIEKRLPQLRTLHISWFGGEPLLAVDAIREICSHIQDLKQLYPHVDYKSSMSTNALKLTPDLLGELVGLGVISYQISLDGDEDFHDLTRITIGKKGTFDRIWNNLIKLKHTSYICEIALRVHLTRKNIESVKQLLIRLENEFSEDTRFTVYFKSIEPLGAQGDDTFPFMGSSEARDVITDLRSLTSLTRPEVEKRAYDSICYAARANSLLIRADGRVGKCTVAFHNPKNTVGCLHPDGTIAFDSGLFKEWIHGTLIGDEDFARCPLPYVNGEKAIQLYLPSTEPA